MIGVRIGGDGFGPLARSSLGEVICLNCGDHRDLVGNGARRVTCSEYCRGALARRGGRMDWLEFRMRIDEIRAAA
jgi:hypothetical protein